MNLEQITKKIDDISAHFVGFTSEEKKSNTKINMLEERINNLQSFLSRPEIGVIQDSEYKTAFNNYIRKGNEENLVKKSLSSGKEEGGVLLVPTLYSKILNEINVRSPMRQLASIETISTNALDLVIEDGKFASGWVGDDEERPETTNPKLKQQRIFVHELYAQPKASQTLIDDSSINIETWLSERLRDSFIRVENEAFIHGDGQKRPFGILHRNEQRPIDTISTDKITPDLFLFLINSLNEEYQANATFLMNRTTLSEVQKLTDTMGRFIWQQSMSESLKQTIFGVPVVCCSEMPSIEKKGLVIAIGDFKSAYKIVDRSGINIMRDPYTDKPFVKFYSVKRVGGDIVNPAAIKLVKLTQNEED